MDPVNTIDWTHTRAPGPAECSQDDVRLVRLVRLIYRYPLIRGSAGMLHRGEIECAAAGSRVPPRRCAPGPFRLHRLVMGPAIGKSSSVVRIERSTGWNVDAGS